MVNESKYGSMIKQGPNGPNVEIFNMKPRKALANWQFNTFMDKVAQTDDRKKAKAMLASYDIISFLPVPGRRDTRQLTGLVRNGTLLWSYDPDHGWQKY